MVVSVELGGLPAESNAHPTLDKLRRDDWSRVPCPMLSPHIPWVQDMR